MSEEIQFAAFPVEGEETVQVRSAGLEGQGWDELCIESVPPELASMAATLGFIVVNWANARGGWHDGDIVHMPTQGGGLFVRLDRPRSGAVAPEQLFQGLQQRIAFGLVEQLRAMQAAHVRHRADELALDEPAIEDRVVSDGEREHGGIDGLAPIPDGLVRLGAHETRIRCARSK